MSLTKVCLIVTQGFSFSNILNNKKTVIINITVLIYTMLIYTKVHIDLLNMHIKLPVLMSENKGHLNTLMIKIYSY